MKKSEIGIVYVALYVDYSLLVGDNEDIDELITAL